MARIVLVDDSMVARANLKRVLLDCGHEVVAEGANGVEGYDLYKEHLPDIILLDITMPGMSGLDCFKQILKEFPDAKSIFVTSIHKSQTNVEAMDLGAISYINKPFTSSKVITAINAA